MAMRTLIPDLGAIEIKDQALTNLSNKGAEN